MTNTNENERLKQKILWDRAGLLYQTPEALVPLDSVGVRRTRQVQISEHSRK